MRHRVEVPTAFLAFDVLRLRGVSLTEQPYALRREALEALELSEPVFVSPRFDDGVTLFEQTKAQGYEGVVAKRRTSVYRCGERSPNWVKTKHWREG